MREVDIGRLQRLMKVMINPLDSCGEDIVPLQLAYVSWFDRLAESRRTTQPDCRSQEWRFRREFQS